MARGHISSDQIISLDAGQITSGSLPATRLPNPSASTLGGVESIAPVSHQFLTSISTSGVPAQAALVAADIPNIAESQVTNLTTDLAAKVPTSRTISTTAPLTGGGDLSANRTFAISNFVGDSGSGGSAGAVPAPSAGDAAAGKFLSADGTFAVPGTGIVANFSPYPVSLTPPLTSAFSWLNPNSYSVSASDKTGRMLVSIPGSSLGVAYMQTAALPSAPYTIDLGVMVPRELAILVASITLKNSGAGTMRSYGLRSDGLSNTSWYLNDQTWTSVTAPSSQNATTVGMVVMGTMLFVRITDNGTNRKVYFSPNGLDYDLWLSQASGTTVIPDSAGIIFFNNVSGTDMNLPIYHWLVSSSILPQFAS